jgi:carbonic anhydrase
MPDTTIAELLERNVRHVESLPEGHFESVQDGQKPAAVSVCCSDSRVSQEGMWAVEEPGWLFSVGNIGNQVRERDGGEEVVSGDFLYPIAFADTRVAVVVGHTGCGAVTAALDRVQSEEPESLPPGIEKRVEALVPIVEDGLDDDRIDPCREVSLVDQLVEYNVDRQVEFLRAADSIPDDVTVAGFVYDFQGVYGDALGRAYLVARGGERRVEALRAALPDRFGAHVRRLLEP